MTAELQSATGYIYIEANATQAQTVVVGGVENTRLIPGVSCSQRSSIIDFEVKLQALRPHLVGSQAQTRGGRLGIRTQAARIT